jgi:hypothetical protein
MNNYLKRYNKNKKMGRKKYTSIESDDSKLSKLIKENNELRNLLNNYKHRDKKLGQLEDKHTQELEELDEKHTYQLEQLEQRHENELDKLEVMHEQEIKELERIHEKEIEDLLDNYKMLDDDTDEDTDEND